MKKQGLLNPELNYALARLGHKNTFVIADAGLPLPAEIPIIDLALVFGIPSFKQVVDAVLAEVVIEGCQISQEAKKGPIGEEIRESMDTHGAKQVNIESITHEQLKADLSKASFIIRTGSNIPYSNVIFRCGTPF